MHECPETAEDKRRYRSDCEDYYINAADLLTPSAMVHGLSWYCDLSSEQPKWTEIREWNEILIWNEVKLERDTMLNFRNRECSQGPSDSLSQSGTLAHIQAVKETTAIRISREPTQWQGL